MRDIERKVRIERAQGLDVELLSASDLQRIAPYVSERMVGGELCRSEGKANPLLATPALARAARRAGRAPAAAHRAARARACGRPLHRAHRAGEIDARRVVQLRRDRCRARDRTARHRPSGGRPRDPGERDRAGRAARHAPPVLRGRHADAQAGARRLAADRRGLAGPPLARGQPRRSTRRRCARTSRSPRPSCRRSPRRACCAPGRAT